MQEIDQDFVQLFSWPSRLFKDWYYLYLSIFKGISLGFQEGRPQVLEQFSSINRWSLQISRQNPKVHTKWENYPSPYPHNWTLNL